MGTLGSRGAVVAGLACSGGSAGAVESSGEWNSVDGRASLRWVLNDSSRGRGDGE
jgi:hypothetical protein